MSKYLFLPFVGQCHNDNCFYISIINSCVYKGLSIPLIFNLKNNDVSNKEDLIKYAGLNMKNGNNINKLFENGGILTIDHPIVKLHSFLMIKEDNNKYVLVNSWFGPTILLNVTQEKIENIFNIKMGWHFMD